MIQQPPLVPLGEVREQLASRQQDFRDETVSAGELQFDPMSAHLVLRGQPHRLQRHALDQLATRLSIPTTYVHRCPAELLARNFNHWLPGLGDVLLRFDRNEVRAVLTPRYRAVSNLDLVESMLETVPEATPVRWEADARIFRVQVYQPGERSGLLGGLGASNSETGFKRVELHACVFRMVCTNGLILPGNATIARRHTREPAATLEEVRDLVQEAWPRSGSYTDRLEATRKIQVPDVPAAFEKVNGRFDLGKPQVQEVEAAYQVEPGSRLFDVVNAYTRAANSPSLPLPERAQLQEVGGHIVAMTEQGHRWL